MKLWPRWRRSWWIWALVVTAAVCAALTPLLQWAPIVLWGLAWGAIGTVQMMRADARRLARKRAEQQAEWSRVTAERQAEWARVVAERQAEDARQKALVAERRAEWRHWEEENANRVERWYASEADCQADAERLRRLGLRVDAVTYPHGGVAVVYQRDAHLVHEQAPLPTTTCGYCSAVVPVAPACARCGAPLMASP